MTLLFRLLETIKSGEKRKKKYFVLTENPSRSQTTKVVVQTDIRNEREAKKSEYTLNKKSFKTYDGSCADCIFCTFLIYKLYCNIILPLILGIYV